MYHPYYLPYMVPQPVFYVLYPSNTPSPAWSFSSQASLPTPAILSNPLPLRNNRPVDGSRIQSPPPKPKPDAEAAEAAPLCFRPRVDPLIVYSHPTAGPSPGWDLYYDIRTLRFTDARSVPLKILYQADFAARPAARAAPQDGGHPLRSIVLIFRYLPFQIEVKPSHSPPKGAPPGPPPPEADFVSDWDVLTALYDYLRTPVDWNVCARMPGLHRDMLHRARVRRLKVLAEPLPHPMRNIDFFCKWHHFNGIRVAEPGEVPKGRRFGEVFVVEVGRG
ncbi:hypothetical protein TRAPUB_1459 [Trametes pubescens]|uniref:DUF6699 domain-containing protein n=1 Tax=Trametes pubescens TaxID=154538 RepID=A0A1M2VJA6_TRAPU|nr:hypothetical protein TRAPUB_1459 [Trametes pubescens]